MMLRKLISRPLHWHRWALRLAATAILLVGTSACSSLAHYLWGQPDPIPSTGNCDPSRVPVLNVHWFKNAEGAWRVMGEIENKSDQVIAALETGVETRTKFDRPADQGEDVPAYPVYLKPGEKAPFTAWIDRNIPNLDHFEVEVSGCTVAEEAQRSHVDMRSESVTVDSAGRAEVTGVMVNPGTQTVLVNGLMAAVYDRKGVMISAGDAQVTPRYLAPGESGAVRVTIELPNGASAAVSSHRFFMDVLAQDAPAALPLDPAQDVRILSHYIDADGRFHLLGQVTNSSAKPVMTAVQAAVFSAGKNQLLDAGQYVTWLPLAPGQTLPFDISDWGTLAALPAALTGSEQNFEYSLRLEPFLSWSSAPPAVSLSQVHSTESIEKGTAIFSGQVKNDTPNGITTGLILAVMKQKTDGKIVAVGNAHLPITDSAAPGAVVDYSLKLPLPAGVDASTLQAEITALGYQP
jgi:hypothetical protein